jgi:hypothetical protein
VKLAFGTGVLYGVTRLISSEQVHDLIWGAAGLCLGIAMLRMSARRAR